MLASWAFLYPVKLILISTPMLIIYSTLLWYYIHKDDKLISSLESFQCSRTDGNISLDTNMGSCPKRQILLYQFSNCQLDFNSSVTEAVPNFEGSEEERAQGKVDLKRYVLN